MANEYSASVTPFRKTVVGLPITTFIASIVSLVLYMISIILIFATKCPMNQRLSYFLAFLIIAMLATCCMAAINMMYKKYHFNCISLSVSLIYSGSAALVLLGLIVTAFNGLCGVQQVDPPKSEENLASIPKTRSGAKLSYRDLFQDSQENQGVFKAGHVGGIFIWSLAAIADAFQIVAHYYYG